LGQSALEDSGQEEIAGWRLPHLLIRLELDDDVALQLASSVDPDSQQDGSTASSQTSKGPSFR
jgi:hypothetical protein